MSSAFTPPKGKKKITERNYLLFLLPAPSNSLVDQAASCEGFTGATSSSTSCGGFWRSAHSWYQPTTPSSMASNSFNIQRQRPYSSSPVSPAEAAGIIALLKDRSVDELRKLSSDKDAYNQFLLSLDQVKIQNNIRDELCKETLQLARNNLEKEPRIMELRNQCRIIRTTELAAAQEKLDELERQKEETLKFYSPASFILRLQGAMNKTEEESEIVHRKLVDREIDLASFVQKYKKLRTSYHRRALIQLGAKTFTV